VRGLGETVEKQMMGDLEISEYEKL